MQIIGRIGSLGRRGIKRAAQTVQNIIDGFLGGYIASEYIAVDYLEDNYIED